MWETEQQHRAYFAEKLKYALTVGKKKNNGSIFSKTECK